MLPSTSRNGEALLEKSGSTGNRRAKPTGINTYTNRRSDPRSLLYAILLLMSNFVTKNELILRRVLYKLYHIEESLTANASEIRKQSRALNGLREDQHRQQQALDNTRAEQAKSKTEVSREERKLKRAEKALEAKVYTSSYDALLRFVNEFGTETRACHRRSPDLACDTQEGQLCQTDGTSRQRYRKEAGEDCILLRRSRGSAPRGK